MRYPLVLVILYMIYLTIIKSLLLLIQKCGSKMTSKLGEVWLWGSFTVIWNVMQIIWKSNVLKIKRKIEDWWKNLSVEYIIKIVLISTQKYWCGAHMIESYQDLTMQIRKHKKRKWTKNTEDNMIYLNINLRGQNCVNTFFISSCQSLRTRNLIKCWIMIISRQDAINWLGSWWFQIQCSSPI